MFEQLQPDGWLSKLSLRGAITNAIGFGFVAGLGVGLMIGKAFWFSLTYWELAKQFAFVAVSVAAAIRLYFLAMSRVKEQVGQNRTRA